MSFWTYMLECADGSFYAGHTDDLDLRYAQHQSGELKCYASSRLPVRLLWSQEFATREEALTAERQVKGWSRKKKQALCRGDWVEIQRLAWGTRNPLPEHLR
jgi:predicted GIY-YIG superfamily endonuclease